MISKLNKSVIFFTFQTCTMFFLVSIASQENRKVIPFYLSQLVYLSIISYAILIKMCFAHNHRKDYSACTNRFRVFKCVPFLSVDWGLSVGALVH